MTHARTSNETLSVEQANILDRYLDKLPNYVLPQFKRRFEAMARELTDLGYIDGLGNLDVETDRLDKCYEAGYTDGYNDGRASF